MKDEQNIPANTVSVDGNSGELYYPYSRMAEIRDFFRYERPIRLTIVAGNGIGTLSNERNLKSAITILGCVDYLTIRLKFCYFFINDGLDFGDA